MTVPTCSESLSEWEERFCPESTAEFIDGGEDVEQLITGLTTSGKLKIYRLKKGLQLRASSYVGRIKIGHLQITIRPKISEPSLLRLMRYAYGLRDLGIYASTSYHTESYTFQDLLIWQLQEEIKELLARGLHRKYSRRDEVLSIPKGRINIQAIAAQAGVENSKLPCIYYPRLEDCLVNRIILAGLKLGTTLTNDNEIRSKLRHLTKSLNDRISSVRLDRHVFRQLWREQDRLTTAYNPAIKIVEILSSTEGISLYETGKSATILYPTANSDAKEARIRIQGPVHGHEKAQVILRPFNLNKFEELISNSSKSREKRDYAQWLAFG